MSNVLQTLTKILVVDDSEKIRNLITRILPTNCNVIEAENGAVALDKFHHHNPELVILDLAMPVMDGYETLSRILELNKHAKVLLLSASDNDKIKNKCLERGAIGYITKPFSKNDLLLAIDSFVSKKTSNYSLMFAHDLCKQLVGAFSQDVPKIQVNLESVQEIKTKYSPQQNIDNSQIREVSTIQEAPKIEPSEMSEGYVSESKRGTGKVISFIDVVDRTILSKYYEDVMEFFNVVNSKVLSKLTNFSDREMFWEPVRMYTPNDSSADEFLRIKLSIKLEDNNIPLECNIRFK